MASTTFPLATPPGGSASTSSGEASSTGPDVLMFQTVDGGEIEIIGGRVTADNPPATAAYLSLFGGNERDGNIAATDELQWWGNLIEDDQSRIYRSETQHLLRSLPAVTSNLARIDDAASRDLAWMVAELDATITVASSIPALNRIKIAGTIEILGRVYTFSFVELWETGV